MWNIIIIMMSEIIHDIDEIFSYSLRNVVAWVSKTVHSQIAMIKLGEMD